MTDSKIDPRKRGLGRGLSALLPNTPAPMAPGAPAGATTTATAAHPPAARIGKPTYFAAGIEDIYPGPEQPRRNFDDARLEQLAQSLRVDGIITPLVVRPRPAGGYFLIAGERRWRAAQRAGLHDVPVVVQDISPAAALQRAIVENVQRADLGPLEEAAAYQRLIDELRLTQEQLAERVGKDRSTIANSLRLLRLPAPVRQLVEDDRLSMGHARALLALPDDAAIEQAARTVVAKGLSVRATEALVKQTAGASNGKGKRAGVAPTAAAPAGKSANARDLEQRLTRALGGPVTIVEDASGKAGTIEIRYVDLDHLDALLDRLL